MEESLLRRLLSRLSLGAYERLVVKLFNSRGDEPFLPLPAAGEHVFFQPIIDSYGGSLHRVYTVHHSPLELMGEFSSKLLADPALKSRIAKVWDLYKGETGSWGMVSPHLKTDRALQTFAFLTNLTGHSKEVYEKEIIPKYSEIAKRLRLRPGNLFVGSYDSFLNLSLEETRGAFAQFVQEDAGELRITLVGDEMTVRRIAVERTFQAGVLSAEGGPSEPVYFCEQDDAVLREFEELLRARVSEKKLETFLAAHHKLIFGTHYDRVETQLWLRFPEFDIANRRRRLDIFLRNSVTRDWELNELKLPTARLNGTYRDVPILARQVTNSLQPLKNYGRLLKHDSVRRRLSSEGIEYYEPTLGLVIGRSPALPHEQWRWLVRTNPDVKITTYDELFSEARLRAIDRAAARYK